MSARLRLLNGYLRLVAKPRLAMAVTPEDAARDFRRLSVMFGVPRNLTNLPRKLPNGQPVHLIRAGITRPGRAILWFHGGGYVSGSPDTHAGMLGTLSRLANTEVIAPVYRMLPEAPFPAAFEDAVRAWEGLLATGLEPGQIALGGDSAGGGLALALLAELCRRGTRPAGLAAMSPWTDLTGSGDSRVTNASRDVLLPVSRTAELVEMYMQGADPADPRVSPLFAEFDAPPPVMLQFSEVEILRDDSLLMAEHLRAAGGEVEIDMWEKVPHVWQLFQGRIPEALTAVQTMAAFYARRLMRPALPPPADES